MVHWAGGACVYRSHRFFFLLVRLIGSTGFCFFRFSYTLDDDFF